jgi:hypothetical protein
MTYTQAGKKTKGQTDRMTGIQNDEEEGRTTDRHIDRCCHADKYTYIGYIKLS